MCIFVIETYIDLMKKIIFTIITFTVTSVSIAQVPIYVPTNGLVGWWPFNGNANDESGNGNNGTVNGATMTTDRFGVVSEAYSFGSSDILISNYFFDNGWNEYSISLWFSTNDITQGTQNFLNTFPHDGEGLGWTHANSPAKISHWKNSDPNQHLWNIFSANPLNYSNVQNGQWYFITIVKSGLTYRYYINGQLDKTSTATVNAISTFTGMRFGSIGGAENLNGKLDDIGIWNRAITECEIADLYQSQLGYLNSASSQSQTALDSYTWPVNGQTYTQSGTYTQTLTNAAGCDSTITLNLTLNFTGIDELENELIVSPNPTQHTLTISSKTEIYGNFSLCDPQGRIVAQGKLQGKVTLIDLSHLSTGNYMLQLESEGKPIKLMKL